MLSSKLIAVLLVLLGSGALAQSDLRARLRPISAPIKDAGVFHLATGQWTRHPAGQDLATAPEIVYANTCATAYYFGLNQGETVTDEGGLPNSQLMPLASTSVSGGSDQNPGCADSYDISGFRIAYCTWNQHAYTTTISFYDRYENAGSPCAIPGMPVQTFANLSLPRNFSWQWETCWVVTLDLTASMPPGTFSLSGTGGSQPKIFGWSWTQVSSIPPNDHDGPIIAGGAGTSPASCTGTDATRWDNGTASIGWPANRIQAGNNVAAIENGTGMLNLDGFRLDGAGSLSGCREFGGNPRASLFLELYAEVPASCPPCTGNCGDGPYCFGDGTTYGWCPCGNNGLVGAGCDNSLGTGGGMLSKAGSASLANDSLAFTQTGELPTALSILIQGTGTSAWGIHFGDGLRCASGNLLRMYAHNASSGSVTIPVAGIDPSVSARSMTLGDTITPGLTRYYGVYYRDPSTTFCLPASGNTWNIGNGYVVTWQP